MYSTIPQGKTQQPTSIYSIHVFYTEWTAITMSETRLKSICIVFFKGTVNLTLKNTFQNKRKAVIQKCRVATPGLKF